MMLYVVIAAIISTAATVDTVSNTAVQLWQLLIAAGGVVATITGGVIGAYKLAVKPQILAEFATKTECSSDKKEISKQLDKIHQKQDQILLIIGKFEGILTTHLQDKK